MIDPLMIDRRITDTPIRVRRKWAVMISGRGSNLAALLELRDEVNISLVLSSNPESFGILRARRAGVPSVVVPFLEGTKKLDWEAIHELLLKKNITHVFLAGFMKIVPALFVEKWEGCILNLHPSLLPAYPGLDSIARAHADRVAIGLTIHEVNEHVDGGKVVCQRQSLGSEVVAATELERVEFLVHVDEQRVVKEAIRRWKQDLTIS